MKTTREVPSLQLRTRISAAGGQELFNAKMASNTTVAGLKEELLLLLFIPRADQELVLSQQKVDDDICLEDLYSLHQEEMQLYGLLRGDMEISRMVEGQVHLDFTLFLQSGFYLFHHGRVSGATVRRGPPGRGVCSFRMCEHPLKQRIFVEKVLPGWENEIGCQDELIEVNHRQVLNLQQDEFTRLLDEALHDPKGVLRFHRGNLETYFKSDNESAGSIGVFCIVVNMLDEELISLRLAPGTTAGELKNHVERLLHVPCAYQQLIQDRGAIQDEEILIDEGIDSVGLRVAMLRLALFHQEELGNALAAGIRAEMSLAFCDPAFLPPGRVAIASVEDAMWPEMLRFLGEDDFEDVSDGQVVAVLPREDYNALLRLGPLNFLFHSADVVRATPIFSEVPRLRTGVSPKARPKATG